MNRPQKLVFVSGAGTEVGKTWLCQQLGLRLIESKSTIAFQKPAQSYDRSDPATDASQLATVSGQSESEICDPQFSFELPLAPPMAAEQLGQPIPRIADLKASVSWPADVDVGIVEGAGGLLSPLASDGSNKDLLVELNPDLVVVVLDSKLGVINQAQLTTCHLSSHPSVLFLNRFEEKTQAENLSYQWLKTNSAVPVFVDIHQLTRFLIN